MARPYVTHVESNIQGGTNVDLGQKTLIVGPNRIGKSTIVRAIELALSGKASDVAGRETLALDADLFTLAPADVAMAHAITTLSNDTDAWWKLAHGKKAQRSGPSAIFPMRDVKTAILGSAETARKFFLSVASRVSWEEVLAEIPPQFHNRLSSYKSPDGAAGLLAAIDGTKKRARDLTATAKAQRATASALSQGLPPPPTATEVERAKAASEGAVRAVQIQAATARLQAIKTKGEGIANRLEALAPVGDSLNAKLAALPASQPLPAVVEHAIAVGEYLTQHDADACPICGAATSKSKIVFSTRVEKAKAKVADALRLAAERRLIEDEIDRVNSEITRLMDAGNRLVAERKTLIEIVGTKTEIPAVDAKRFAELVAIGAKWESVRIAEGKAIEAETDATIMSQLPAVCTAALARILDKTRTAFEARVQKFLPDSMRFGMELRDGDREVCRIGLRVEAGLRTALSGAEWATVTAALAQAVAEASPAVGHGPVIVVPEDRDFDPNTLADVMEKFGAFDGQVIMTTTKHPARVVAGWTVIDLGKPLADVVLFR